MRAYQVFCLSAAALMVLACASPTAPEIEGAWGGPEVSLTLARPGGALSYLCGAGTIDSGWTLSHSGRFEATGVHFFGGGPAPPQGHPPHPARYAGYLSGDHFSITVVLLDTADTLGTFGLVRGGPPVSEECV